MESRNMNVNVDLNRTKPLKCTKPVPISIAGVCGCEEFKQVFFLRIIPAFLSPTLREEIIPIPAFKCIKCGSLADMDQKKPEKPQ